MKTKSVRPINGGAACCVLCGQEIVHTLGSFSSLAAELLQCHARGLASTDGSIISAVSTSSMGGVARTTSSGGKRHVPYAQSPQRNGRRLGTGSTYPSG